MSNFELAEYELTLLRQAVRVTDTLDALQDRIDADGELVDGKVHPALVERRLQQRTLGQLLASLRVPLTEDEAGDGPDAQPGAGQPQPGGPRGFYGIRGAVS